MARPSILALSGSLRRASVSTAILTTLAERVADRADLSVFPLADVPLYNGDLDGETKPAGVEELKRRVAESDGLVLATPEYNYGISGVLKNAVDWVSRPAYNSVLKNKPVLIITSSPGATGGVRAQQQTRETLVACLARVIARPEVVIPFAYEKVKDGRLHDEATLKFASEAMNDLITEIELLRRES